MSPEIESPTIQFPLYPDCVFTYLLFFDVLGSPPMYTSACVIIVESRIFIVASVYRHISPDCHEIDEIAFLHKHEKKKIKKIILQLGVGHIGANDEK